MDCIQILLLHQKVIREDCKSVSLCKEIDKDIQKNVKIVIHLNKVNDCNLIVFYEMDSNDLVVLILLKITEVNKIKVVIKDSNLIQIGKIQIFGKVLDQDHIRIKENLNLENFNVKIVLVI